MRKKTALMVAGLLIAFSVAGPVDGAFHFALSKSAPSADAAGPAPEEVRLWFTQAPQEGSIAIRLIDSGGDAVETGAPTRDDTDAKVFSVAVERTLDGGVYTVAWRGIGDDGHVVRGEFGFTVSVE